ncbi:GNAT family N-acetyltransferase [Nocardioides sp. BP30]|uniref:GNAT family N-acetyltransferase n=1 Tax=Nocardioides sp. BP30 TaxID=3036374 RepID=UPI0024694AC4|nr:GNAT family N-acetyltransferase [Nocardioides sp. BP30]WGL52543.1 GNAT family N-acetyltransferase [Nocardioides sp. BP30]
MTLDRLADLAAPCRSCLFWELDPVRRDRVPAQERIQAKEAWLSEVLREWGSCGRVAVVEDRPVGFVVYVPAAYAPGADAFPTAPVSPDAVLLTTVWLDPQYAGGGLGRMLVQGMARDLIRRGGVKAVEAFGDVGPMSAISHGSRCAAPAEFLARVGFKTHRAHPTAPRLRMDLGTAVTWRDEVEAALEKLLGAVRPHHQPHPRPVPRAGTHFRRPDHP